MTISALFYQKIRHAQSSSTFRVNVAVTNLAAWQEEISLRAGPPMFDALQVAEMEDGSTAGSADART